MVEDIKKHKNLTFAKQLGFKPSGETGNNVYGNCTFCGKPGKLHINVKTKAFDCKSCGVEGGFKTFLTAMIKVHKKKKNTPKFESLAKNRSLPSQCFKQHRMVFNPNNNTFMLPIYDAEGKNIWDIRNYDGKKFMSLSGCNVGLFGWDQIHESNTVYIVEGEWDKMALEVMLQEKEEKAVVVSTPGAQTFKATWTQYFSKMNVIVCFDNDDAGKKGANKVYKTLKSTVKSIKFVHWPEKKKDGYDVRDFLIETKKLKSVRLKRLTKYLQSEPPFVEGIVEKESKDDEEKLAVYDGEYINPKDVYKMYRKWLYLESTDSIDVLFGTAIANRMQGDPLWLFLVAPPGGTKTELVNTISSGPNIYTTSSLTAKSLVSGANMPGGGDPSLIPKLNNKVLIIKDFTTILNMPQINRDEIIGILRDAYDGKSEKDFGNGLKRSYESHFGIISAVTPVIDYHSEGNTALGERFLRYNIPHSKDAKNNMKMMDAVFENNGKESQMREELSTMGSAVLAYDFKVPPKITDKHRKKIMALAQYVANMRGTVIRDKYTGDVTHKAFSEFGTRMLKQFTKFLNGVCMFKGLTTLTDTEFKLACDMGRATIPTKMEKMVEHMWFEDPDEDYTTKELSEALSLPLQTINRTADDLRMLGMMKKESGGPGKSFWSLSSDAVFLIKQSEIYK